MATAIPERSLPSVLAVAFATAIIAGLSGYFLGQASTIGVSAHNDSDSKRTDPQEDDPAEESDEDDPLQQELKDFDDQKEECKLVLVVRTDLGMTKGALIAPCGATTLCSSTPLILTRDE